jgi:hypothetical protein
LFIRLLQVLEPVEDRVLSHLLNGEGRGQLHEGTLVNGVIAARGKYVAVFADVLLRLLFGVLLRVSTVRLV